MNELDADRDTVRNVALLSAGMVAGGIVAAIDGGIVLPVLVIGAVVVAMLLADRYDL